MWSEARRRRKRSYEYFERLTFVRLVRGLSVNVGRVKEKGNEARNTLEGMKGLMCGIKSYGYFERLIFFLLLEDYQ